MYYTRKINPTDRREYQQVTDLLKQENLTLEAHLDCTYGLFDDEQKLAATGSAYKNTLRCIAVQKVLQGQGLLPLLISALIADRNDAGFFNLFIYTKYESAYFFEQLGFYPVASVTEKLVFLENKKNGFAKYLASLKSVSAPEGSIGAVIINANPFTKGHAYLIEQAAAVCNHVHVFIVSDNASLIPFAVRERLIKEGTAHLTTLSYHKTEDYLISSATFPAYFLKDSDEAITVQASLDAALFIRIARTLAIAHRFVGDEPFSRVTRLYNSILQHTLPKNGIYLHTIPRKTTAQGIPISASAARICLQHGDFANLAEIVPQTTVEFFRSEEGKKIIEKLRTAENVIHY